MTVAFLFNPLVQSIFVGEILISGAILSSQPSQLVASSLFSYTILFFLSFFVQFVDPSYEHPLLSFLLLAVILQCISFAYLSVLAFAGQGLARRFNRHPLLIVLSMSLVGLLFIGFAIKLWQAQLM